MPCGPPSVTASAKASEMARYTPGVRSVRNDVTYERKSEMSRDRSAAWNNPDRAQSAEVRAMQEALKDRGYNPGPIDGLMGPRTAAALREYQRTEKLTVTGQMDAATVSSLSTRKRQSP